MTEFLHHHFYMLRVDKKGISGILTETLAFVEELVQLKACRIICLVCFLVHFGYIPTREIG